MSTLLTSLTSLLACVVQSIAWPAVWCRHSLCASRRSTLTPRSIPTDTVRVGRLPRLLGAACLGAAALGMTGCQSVGYYAQAVSGHISLMRAREPIDELLEKPDLDADLRTRLENVQAARRFAFDELALPDNHSYQTYAATGRDAVTWNVVATDEFSLQAHTWCFPIAGCVSYRGYFDRADADAFAAELASTGADVTVGGASAYSTLGWFEDPILDTMLRGGQTRYLGTLFHEIAHQRVYIKNDSSFNEAYATFVQQQGMREWLHYRGLDENIAPYEASLQRNDQFLQLLRETRSELEALYASDRPEAAMRQGKAEAFEAMRTRYAELKAQWQDYAGYDGWFARELNNARLTSVSTYQRFVPAFARLFDQLDGDWEAFHAAVQALGEKAPEARLDSMEALLETVSPASDS